jgi:hypothetical protein
LRRPSLLLLLVVVVAAVWSPAGALAGDGGAGQDDAAHAAAAIGADGFLSPDRTTWCSGSAKEVGCVSLQGKKSHGAVLTRGGKVTLCPEGSAGPAWKCFQNFDESAPVLHYGQRVETGPFVCASTRRGIACKVRSDGRGFRIDRREAVALP